MGKTSALGSVQLFLGKMLSTIILAIGSIILTILISEGDYGLYIVALIPATTALLFQDLGVGLLLVRIIVVVEIVEAYDLIAAFQQPFGKMTADESCGSGNECFHYSACC